MTNKELVTGSGVPYHLTCLILALYTSSKLLIASIVFVDVLG